MLHVVWPGAPATGPYRMGQAPAAARLVAPTGGTLGVISGLLRTAAGTIDLTAVAAAANKHLRSTTHTHEQPGRRRHRRGLAHARGAGRSHSLGPPATAGCPLAPME